LLKVDGSNIQKEDEIKNIENYDLILIHTPHSTFNNIEFDKVNTLIFDTTGSFSSINIEKI